MGIKKGRKQGKQDYKNGFLYKVCTVFVALLLLAGGFYKAQNGGISVPAGAEKAHAVSDGTSTLCFRNEDLLNEHYQKHGINMGYSSPSEYEAAAADVVMNQVSLHKLEAEDGDDVYYLEPTNEFVIVSADGFIRTYFYPNDGIAYFNRQ